MRPCKVILVGDPAVGKSSLRKSLNGGEFSDAYRETIGIDFSRLHIGRVDVSIWDIKGQTQDVLPPIYNIYTRDLSAVIYCFDQSNRQSFFNVLRKRHVLRGIIKPCIEILVATKIDKGSSSEDIARNFAMKNSIPYILTSAKENIGIENLKKELGGILNLSVFGTKKDWTFMEDWTFIE